MKKSFKRYCVILNEVEASSEAKSDLAKRNRFFVCNFVTQNDTKKKFQV